MKRMPRRHWLCLSIFLWGGLAGPLVTQAMEPFAGITGLEWSQRLANSELTRRGDSLAYTPAGKAKWDYTAGLFTLALLKLNEQKPDARYVTFAQKAIGSFIAADGTIQGYRPEEYQLDALNPGKTVLALWTLTHEERYRKAAAILRKQLDAQPRTFDGGFWHKQRYTNQMWLDGLYMGAPFYAGYAATFGGDEQAYDDVTKQICLMDKHAYDRATGLFYHGWDAAKVQPWANPATGCSSNFWGRAVGWYAMSLVDVLDYLPSNHPGRAQLIERLQKLAAGVVKYQDAQTGLWWQVLDQGGRSGNYYEATACTMFVYTLAKGVHHNYLPPGYATAATKGYAAIIKHLIHDEGNGQWSLTHCCQVAGLGGSPANGNYRDGSFSYYVGEPVVNNDLKGVGPFILAGIEVQAIAPQ